MKEQVVSDIRTNCENISNIICHFSISKYQHERMFFYSSCIANEEHLNNLQNLEIFKFLNEKKKKKILHHHGFSHQKMTENLFLKVSKRFSPFQIYFFKLFSISDSYFLFCIQTRHYMLFFLSLILDSEIILTQADSHYQYSALKFFTKINF
jgi:hypothetical protein